MGVCINIFLLKIHKLYKLHKLTSISNGVLVVFQVSVICITLVLVARPLFCQLHSNLKCLRAL